MTFQSRTLLIEEGAWITYTDPRFGFQLDYPADWNVISRDDSDPKALGTVLTFISPSSELMTIPNEIVIGLHLSELEPNQSLSNWNELYKEASRAFDEESLVSENPQTLKVAGRDALYDKGISPITEYQSVQVVWGKTIWFIWTNSHDAITTDVFKRVIKSFRFGDKTPTTLREIYGDNFKPQQWDRVDSQAGWRLPNNFLTVVGLPSAHMWWSPVTGGPYNVTCGSEYHTGKAEYAADVGVYRKSVYSARTGTVSFAGWNANGYGNLIKLNTSQSGTTYTHYYAHLESIYKTSGTANTFDLLGISGDTGNGPYHLHFHVQTSTDAVNLTGMNGFSPNGYYPGGDDVVCGTMGR